MSLFRDDPYHFGYDCLGPFLARFCEWLEEGRGRFGERSTLLFMARDCCLIHEIHGTLFPERAAESRYVLGSRAAFRFARLADQEAVRRELASVTARETVGDVLARRFHLLEEDWPEGIERPGPNALGASATSRDGRAALEACIGKSIDAVVERSRRHRQCYADYLRRTAGDGTPVVVDIGYVGTAQRAIASWLGRSVGGAYMVTHVGARETTASVGPALAFDGELVAPKSSESVVNEHRYFFEAVLSSFERGLLHFAEPDAPVFEPEPPDERSRTIRRRVHDGARDFARARAGREPEASDGAVAEGIATLKRFLADPSARDARLFAGLAFEDFLANVPRLYVIAPDDERDRSYALWVAGQEAIDRSSFRAPPRRVWDALGRVERAIAGRALSKAQHARFMTHRARFLSEAASPWWRLYGRVTAPVAPRVEAPSRVRR